jgi:PadR family transcriptional regulator PadR
MEKEILKGHLPILILGILEKRPLHGYALCEEIKASCAPGLSLGEGTIYPLLYRLERQGRLRGKWEQSPSGKERKVYHVTRSGRKMIQAHSKDWRTLSEAFQSILGEDWALS